MDSNIKKEAIQFFKCVNANSDNIIKEMQVSVYNLCGISTNDEKITNFIKEAIEKFDFNTIEKAFFEKIKAIISEQSKKIEIKLSNNNSIDYLNETNSLINQLNSINIIDLRLEDNLKQLATQLETKFPMTGISRDDLITHFMKKQEQISNMIQQYNNKTIQALNNLAPHFMEQLKESHENNKLHKHPNIKQEKNVITQQNNNIQIQEQNELNNNVSVDDFITKCSEKLNEIDLMFKNTQNTGISKSEISKGFRQMQHFVENLKNKKFAQEILDKYIKLNQIAQNMIYDEIIFQNVPSLKEIYKKYQKFIIDENIRENIEPKKPDNPTPNINTYIGASTEEISNLINKKQYFSILQSIKKEDTSKYSNFINTGYQIIINKFYETAASYKTYEQQHSAYFELYDIYQNFRDYIPIELSNQLQNQLNNMLKFLQQNKPNNEIIGVRYNSQNSINSSKKV